MSENKTKAENSSTTTPADVASSPKSASKPSRRALRLPRRLALFDTVESAAAKLSLDSAALRARLRRAQCAQGGAVVADLGGGIRGFKFGKSWRIRFPEA